MSSTDERTERQFNKFGFIKEVIFLGLVVTILIYRIIGGLDVISIIFLLTVPIVSALMLTKGIKKKRLSINDVISGIIAGDERILNIIDASGMKGVGFGTGTLLFYIMYGEVRFSPESIALELLLFLLVCFDIAIEGRFINKTYIANTDAGFEQPYYDDNKKKKEIMKRIVKSWFKFAILFTLGDVIASINILKESPITSLYKYIILLPGEMVLCLVFSIIDILLMKYINKKVYNQVK